MKQILELAGLSMLPCPLFRGRGQRAASTVRTFTISSRRPDLCRCGLESVERPSTPAVKTKPKKKTWKSKRKSRRGYGWNIELGQTGALHIMSPQAARLFRFLRKQRDVNDLWDTLDSLPPGQESWEHLTDSVIEMRNQKNWLLIVHILEWLVQCKQFRPDVMCFNLLMEAYGKVGRCSEAEKTFSLLRKLFVVPTDASYSILMAACLRDGQLEKVEQLADEMEERRYEMGLSTYNILLDALYKAGKHRKAEVVFRRMRVKGLGSAASFTTMINVYGRAGYPKLAEDVFKSMGESGCTPTLYTLTALINAYAKQGLCIEAETVFQGVRSLGFDPDVYCYNALMSAYSCGGYPAGAAEVFEGMCDQGVEPDQVSYNILIDAFGRAGLTIEGENVYEEMKSKGFRPTLVSCMLLLKGFDKAGQVQKAELLLESMEKDGQRPDTFMYNSLLHAYGKRGNLEQVERVLSKMKSDPSSSPDVSTYNILININAQAGFVQKAREAFEELQRQGFAPDVTSWTSLMGGYARMKLFKECLSIFETMIEVGCVPDAATWRVLSSSCSSEEQSQQVIALVETYDLSLQKQKVVVQ